ncbi:hypothetical protein SISNIDRAFT_471769 [Sistotremastrum niveocremeum HHB9708]|uniref:Nucleoplasmin-like domain-containing protein n=1 Tax=Sistotremastrum niveocremeum HHB9708 TaxID=1314777 RepID=A0A164M860_9AGAM|nr:hypothetical protein SISNIDRAFT_471769 [Sistotremastrum niveocremeum HHB9708]
MPSRSLAFWGFDVIPRSSDRLGVPFTADADLHITSVCLTNVQELNPATVYIEHLDMNQMPPDGTTKNCPQRTTAICSLMPNVAMYEKLDLVLRKGEQVTFHIDSLSSRSATLAGYYFQHSEGKRDPTRDSAGPMSNRPQHGKPKRRLSPDAQKTDRNTARRRIGSQAQMNEDPKSLDQIEPSPEHSSIPQSQVDVRNLPAVPTEAPQHASTLSAPVSTGHVSKPEVQEQEEQL